MAEHAQCWCQTCRPITLSDMRMALCPDCGNKRCPRATNHIFACTGSNEPGQHGSAYGVTYAPTPPAATAAPSDADILHVWDTHVGEPSTTMPLVDSDKIAFARAILQRYGQAPAASAEPAWAQEIIDDLQAQFDSEMITENDSGEALIRLDNAIAAVEDAAKRYAPVAAQAQSWAPAGPLRIECDPDRFGQAPWHVTDGRHHAVGATPNEALNGFSRYLAAQAPAANGDALDAARYRFIRDVPYCDLVRNVMALQQNAIMDETIDAAMQRTTGSDHD